MRTARNIVMLAVLLAAGASAQVNLVANAGYFDLDTDGNFGDGWGAFGAAGFNDFFGPGNPHASFFADTIGNSGGVFQAGIAATPGSAYRFDAQNVRIEGNFDGEFIVAMEFYAADDTTKIGEAVRVISNVDPNNPEASGDGLAFSVRGTAPVGTAFVRPLLAFDNVQSTGGVDRNVFVFSAAIFELVPGSPFSFNGGFEDVTGDGDPGDGWGQFGNVDFNAFFGANGHASLFADNLANFGIIWQEGIPGQPGVTYQLDLADTRIEANWNADLVAGFEYYISGGDPNNPIKIGESMTLLDTATRVAAGSVDGNVFSVTGTAAPGTEFVRPVIQFDSVDPNYLLEPQANTFIFDIFMSQSPQPGDAYARNPTFADFNGDNIVGDRWRAYGAAGYNAFFGADNGHLSLFADTIGNFGGGYQSAILAEPNATYRFDLLDVRIEDNFDADLRFGLEFFAGDDATKVGEAIEIIDTSTTGDGLSFSMTGQAPAGAVYVRPLVAFDNVGSTGGSLRNAFVFAVALTETDGTTPCPGDVNGDSLVDLSDLALVLANFGAVGTPGSQPGDADANGTVDLSDLALVLANFGATCP